MITRKRFERIALGDLQADPPQAVRDLVATIRTLVGIVEGVVDSAITDADTCPICRSDIHKHSDGCSVQLASNFLDSFNK